MIAICGDNPSLYRALEEVESRGGGRLRRVGFTNHVSEYLSASDVLVTKPGPGSLAEAFHQQVPMVVACNAHTIPQERYNARIVQDGGLGVAVRRWREIPAAVTALRGDPERLDGCRRRLAALPPNRAVFEVLDLVERTRELAGAPIHARGSLAKRSRMNVRRAERSVSSVVSRRIDSDARRWSTTSAQRSAPHSDCEGWEPRPRRLRLVAHGEGGRC